MQLEAVTELVAPDAGARPAQRLSIAASISGSIASIHGLEPGASTAGVGAAGGLTR